MLKTIRGKCQSCKRIENLKHAPIRNFKIIETSNNKKLVCEVCGFKIFIKGSLDPEIYLTQE